MQHANPVYLLSGCTQYKTLLSIFCKLHPPTSPFIESSIPVEYHLDPWYPSQYWRNTILRMPVWAAWISNDVKVPEEYLVTCCSGDQRQGPLCNCHKLLGRSFSIDDDGDFMVFSVTHFKLIDLLGFLLIHAPSPPQSQVHSLLQAR